MTRRIVIMPGHYQLYKGVNKNDIWEYDICENLVCSLESALSQDDYDVSIIRGTVLEKINQTNSIHPDIAIEIHTGNSNNSKVSGSRVFYNNAIFNSKLLSEILLMSMVKMLGTHNQGSYVGWYKKISPSMVKDGKISSSYLKDFKPKIDLILSKIQSTTALIEPFFLSSPQDVQEFVITDKSEFIAESIRRGINGYFGVNL